MVDTLLSLHHPNDSGAASTPVDEGEPSFKILLQSTIDLSDDAQGADTEAAGLEVVRRDSLEDLKNFIQNLDGALEDGWQVEVQRGKHGKLNKAFISPSREKFRSRVEVAKHLGVFGKKKLGLKDQCASNGGSKGIHSLTYQRSEIHINPVMIDSDETQAKNAFGDPTRFGKPTHEDPQNEAFQLHGPDTKAHPDGEESSGHRKDVFVPAKSDGKLSENSNSGTMLKSDKAKTTKEVDNLLISKKELPLPAVVTQHCQYVLRDIISAEKFGALSNMLNCGSSLGSLEAAHHFKAPALISGSLDLQLIGLRLASGAYGQTPDMFSADMQQVWKNISLYGNELVSLANSLAELSDSLYKDQVLSLFPADSEVRVGTSSSHLGQLPGQEQGLSLQRHVHHKQSVDCNGQLMEDSHVSKEMKNAPLKVLPLRGARKVNVHRSGVEPTQCQESSSQEQLTLSHQVAKASSLKFESPSSKKANTGSRHVHRSSEQAKKPQAALTTMIAESSCKKCGLKQGTDYIACTRCNAGYHTYCIGSGFTSSPEKDWYCLSCTPKPVIVDFAQETREDTNGIQKLSLLPDESGEETSESSKEVLPITGKGGVCKSCGKEDDNVLLCDACDDAYHMNCLTPAIEGVPDGNWFCPACAEDGKKALVVNDTDQDHHCAVCDRIGGKSLVAVESELAEHLVASNTRNACKLCGVDKGKKSTISCYGCEKLYHLSCLRPALKKFPSGIWFCPSCLCRACKVNKDDDKILLCDTCDEGYHTYCLVPPLSDIPEGSWFCPSCAIPKSSEAVTSSGDAALISSESKRMLTESSKRKRKSSEPRRSL